jgi:hypothetical protein
VTVDVLETRTSKAGAVEHLVKVELLNLPLWVAAEFCTDVPRETVVVEPVTVYAPTQCRQGVAVWIANTEVYEFNQPVKPMPEPVATGEIPQLDATKGKAVAVSLITPREWLISQGYELARAAGVSAATALEAVVNEWCREDQYQGAVDYYLSAMQSERARLRLYRAVESKAASAAIEVAVPAA